MEEPPERPSLSCSRGREGGCENVLFDASGFAHYSCVYLTLAGHIIYFLSLEAFSPYILRIVDKFREP